MGNSPRPVADGLAGPNQGASVGSKLTAGAYALRNLLLGGNLASLSLLLSPTRMVGYVNEALFMHRAMTGTHGLPQRNVFEVIPGDGTVDIRLGNLRPTDGEEETWLHPIASYATDLMSLCLLCQLVKPKTVFEIGTLRGYTTLHFALNVATDARVLTLDLPIGKPNQPALKTTAVDTRHIEMHGAVRRYCFDGSEVASKITCLFGDSATFDYTPYHGAVDLFFIDGAHSYEYVRSDTMRALECCHPGSVIAWHDFGRFGVNGVSRWLREFARDHAVYSVPGGSLAFMRVE
jgi:predicted O-methyltransferase YrrM